MESFQLANDLRRAGVNVVCYPEAVKLAKQFKYADRIGAKVTLVIGPDEVEKAQVAVKDLVNGEQVTVAREALVETVRGIIGR